MLDNQSFCYLMFITGLFQNKTLMSDSYIYVCFGCKHCIKVEYSGQRKLQYLKISENQFTISVSGLQCT